MSTLSDEISRIKEGKDQYKDTLINIISSMGGGNELAQEGINYDDYLIDMYKHRSYIDFRNAMGSSRGRNNINIQINLNIYPMESGVTYGDFTNTSGDIITSRTTYPFGYMDVIKDSNNLPYLTITDNEGNELSGTSTDHDNPVFIGSMGMIRNTYAQSTVTGAFTGDNGSDGILLLINADVAMSFEYIDSQEQAGEGIVYLPIVLYLPDINGNSFDVDSGIVCPGHANFGIQVEADMVQLETKYTTISNKLAIFNNIKFNTGNPMFTSSGSNFSVGIVKDNITIYKTPADIPLRIYNYIPGV